MQEELFDKCGVEKQVHARKDSKNQRRTTMKNEKGQ